MATQKARVTRKTNATKSKATKPQATRRQPQPLIGKPDTSVLARYSPTDGTNAHPDWVKRQFPTYITPHAGHDTTAVREFTHDGHVITIITTYRVEVDGRPMAAHLSVDEDGRVFTHATPFVTYASAVDLMKAVIDAYPGAFSGASEPGRHPEHTHGTGHRGARR
jgi:hypothetical protein